MFYRRQSCLEHGRNLSVVSFLIWSGNRSHWLKYQTPINGISQTIFSMLPGVGKNRPFLLFWGHFLKVSHLRKSEDIILKLSRLFDKRQKLQKHRLFYPSVLINNEIEYKHRFDTTYQTYPCTNLDTSLWYSNRQEFSLATKYQELQNNAFIQHTLYKSQVNLLCSFFKVIPPPGY